MKVSLVSFLRPFFRHAATGLFFKLLEAALELALPLLLAQIIDVGIAQRDVPFIYKSGLQMFLLIIAGLICAVICQYCAAVTAQGFGDKLRTALFRHINRLSVNEQRVIGTESLVYRVTGDVERLQLAVSMMVRLGTRIPFVIVGAVLASVVVDLPLSMVILTAAIAFIIVTTVIILTVFPLYSELQKRLDRIGRVLRESFLGVRVIRAFRRREAQKKRFDLAVEAHERSAVRAAKVSSFMQPATQLIMNLAICGVLWFGSFRVNSGVLSTGRIVALINYILQILVALVLVANLIVIFTRAAASRVRVREVLALAPASAPAGTLPEPAEADAGADEGEPTGLDRSGSKTALEFLNVAFRYPGEHNRINTRDALRDISFHIGKTETLAITGTTGSGKSTIISLILRLLYASEGRIRFMGQDISQIPVDELRGRIAVVHQAPKLFSGTIRDNLLWGNKDASDPEIREALKIAQALDFVETLPEGLSAHVERNGRNFSGGQKQRLAIARAVVRKADLLILDDSASALDYVTEARLYRALAKANRKTGRTLVAVSQRIAAIRSADRILVLDEGRMVGFGTHRELLEDCGEYKEIVDSQLFGKEAK